MSTDALAIIETLKEIVASPDEFEKDSIDEYVAFTKEFLGKASDAFYNTDSKLVSDPDYDQIVELLQQVTGEEVEFGANAAKGLAELEHTQEEFQGTLRPHNDVASAVAAIKALYPANMAGNVFLCSSLKMDGNSVSIDYDARSGGVIKGVTRGKDGKGVDLTSKMQTYVIVPDPDAPEGGIVSIKYEAIVPFTKLAEYNENTTGREYKNPRSMATGKLASDDFSEAVNYVRLVPLEMRKSWSEDKYYRELNWVQMNKMTSEHDHFIQLAPEFYRGNLDGIEEWLQKQYDTTIAERGDLDVMIDGLVIELMNPNLREELGWTSGRSNYAFKLKLPYIEAETVCTGFRFDYGKTTGRITAVINFETVVINNSDFNNVSLANYARWQELQPLGIGTKLLFQYRNDVMGYVEKLSIPENDNIDPFEHITHCPKCNTELEKQRGTGKFSEIDTFIKCPNIDCSGNVIGNGVVWCTKLGIKGVGESQIAALYDAGMFSSVADLYSLDLDKVAALDGMGKQSANKLNKAVHAKKTFLDYEVCGSLAIDGVGRSTFRDLFQVVNFWELMQKISDDEDNDINVVAMILAAKPENIQTKTAVKIAKGLWERYNLIVDLSEILEIEDSRVEVAEDFVVKKFCVTGSLDNWAKRSDLKKVLEQMGHSVSSGVSKNTDYLVTNDPSTGSDKLTKAEKFNVPVISEAELIKLFNISV